MGTITGIGVSRCLVGCAVIALSACVAVFALVTIYAETLLVPATLGAAEP